MANTKTIETLDGRKKLSANELKYMQFLWNFPDGINSDDIYKHFNKKSRGVVGTTLHNINAKGYLRIVRNGLHNIYYPAITEKAYKQGLLKQSLLTQGHTSLESLIAAYCGIRTLSDVQKEKIQNLMKELENEKPD